MSRTLTLCKFSTQYRAELCFGDKGFGLSVTVCSFAFIKCHKINIPDKIKKAIESVLRLNLAIISKEIGGLQYPHFNNNKLKMKSSQVDGLTVILFICFAGYIN